MPSKPRPARGQIRVRHASGAEKNVARSKLLQLGPNWTRVRNTKKSSGSTSGKQPSASSSAPDPADPGDEKENADDLHSDGPGRD